MKRLHLFSKSFLMFISFSLFFIGCSPKHGITEGLVAKELKQVFSKTLDGTKSSYDFDYEDQSYKLLTEKDEGLTHKKITISMAPIVQTAFDAPISAVSPLISIELSEKLNSPLKVRVPVAKKVNQTVAAVSYRMDTQVLSVLQSVFVEDEVLEVLVDATTAFFISRVAEDLVLADISTGFLPSVDGFQIPNVRTYWEDGGMCSGLTLGSLFYFERYKSNHGALFGRFVEETGFSELTTPGFVIDDEKVFQLGASLQNIDMPSTYGDMWETLKEDSSAKHFYRMAYHMLLSKQPQIVHLFEKPYDKSQSESVISGHAVIAYRISGNRAYIYDPNLPSNDSLYLELNMETMSMKDYQGAFVSMDTNFAFRHMIYYPMWDVLNRNRFESVWSTFLKKELLQVKPDRQLVEVVTMADGREMKKPVFKYLVTNKSKITLELVAPTTSYAKLYDQRGNYLYLTENGRVSIDVSEKMYVGVEWYLPVAGSMEVYAGFDWLLVETKEHQPWTVMSQIIDVSSSAGYSQEEIAQMLGKTMVANIQMLYVEEENYYSMIVPTNQQEWVMKRKGNVVTYSLSTPIDQDVLMTDFVGTVSEDGKKIIGESVVSLLSKGELYTLQDVLTLDE